jgi:hypothetical protein
MTWWPDIDGRPFQTLTRPRRSRRLPRQKKCSVTQDESLDGAEIVGIREQRESSTAPHAHQRVTRLDAVFIARPVLAENEPGRLALPRGIRLQQSQDP